MSTKNHRRDIPMLNIILGLIAMIIPILHHQNGATWWPVLLRREGLNKRLHYQTANYKVQKEILERYEKCTTEFM